MQTVQWARKFLSPALDTERNNDNKKFLKKEAGFRTEAILCLQSRIFSKEQSEIEKPCCYNTGCHIFHLIAALFGLGWEIG